MYFKQPIRFVPNIRIEKHDSNSGYNWGQYARDSRILNALPLHYRSRVNAEHPLDSIAERWLISDDLKFPSMAILPEGKTASFRELLENHAKDLLGLPHTHQLGSQLGVIMKIIETHPVKEKGSLSVQVHPSEQNKALPQKPEMWLGEGNIFIGWNQNVSEDLIKQHSAEGTLETLLNAYHLNSDYGINVAGGLIHAIRYGSYIKEWSVSVKDGIHDLSSATVALYDRTDGKKCREGKEDIKQALAILTDNQSLRKTNTDEFLVIPNVLDVANSHKRELIFNHHGIRVQKLTLSTAMDVSVSGTGLSMWLEKGCCSVICDGNESTFESGEEWFIPACMRTIKLSNQDKQMQAVIYYWHAEKN